MLVPLSVRSSCSRYGLHTKEALGGEKPLASFALLKGLEQ